VVGRSQQEVKASFEEFVKTGEMEGGGAGVFTGPGVCSGGAHEQREDEA